MKQFPSLRFLFRSTASAVVLLSSVAWAAAQGSYSGVIAFGDSLSDRGNTITVTGYNPVIAYFSHYDSTYFHSSYNDYGIEAGGRWSSGPTWVEYLAGNLTLGQSGSAPVDLGRNNGSMTTGTNFAWAGSTTGLGHKDVSGYQLSNLRNQVSDYIALSATVGFPAISTALYTVWSGGNDAIDWVEAGRNMSTLNATVQAAHENIVAAIESLYLNGGRHFVVPNLPALGVKPDYLTDPAKHDAANVFVNLFNAGLATGLADLRGLLPEIQVIELDVYGIFTDLLSNPGYYGLTNVTDPAWAYGWIYDDIVDHPEEYLFWDNTHPTTQVHQILGNLAYQTAIPEPGVVWMGMAGAGVLLLIRYRRRALAA